MPIRIQSLAKDMRTVVLTMTGWVVLGDDVVVAYFAWSRMNLTMGAGAPRLWG